RGHGLGDRGIVGQRRIDRGHVHLPHRFGAWLGGIARGHILVVEQGVACVRAGHEVASPLFPGAGRRTARTIWRPKASSFWRTGNRPCGRRIIITTSAMPKYRYFRSPRRCSPPSSKSSRLLSSSTAYTAASTLTARYTPRDQPASPRNRHRQPTS